MNKENIGTLVAIYNALSVRHMEAVGKHEFRSADAYENCISMLAQVLSSINKVEGK